MTGKKILIVEDEAITAMELEESLKNRGYDVVGAASSGPEAIRITREKWPDLILMDIRIEGKMDGIETAYEIGLFHDTPVIFLTAYSDDLTLSRVIRTKSHSFLLKPFNERELYSNIEMAINKHKMFEKSCAIQRIIGSMFDLISDGIVTTDKDGIIRRVNSIAEKMIGLNRDQIAGKPFFDAISFTTEQKEILTGMIRNADKGSDTIIQRPYPVTLQNAAGTESIVSLKIEIMRLPNGEIVESIFIFARRT